MAIITRTAKFYVWRRSDTPLTDADKPQITYTPGGNWRRPDILAIQMEVISHEDLWGIKGPDGEEWGITPYLPYPSVTARGNPETPLWICACTCAPEKEVIGGKVNVAPPVRYDEIVG